MLSGLARSFAGGGGGALGVMSEGNMREGSAECLLFGGSDGGSGGSGGSGGGGGGGTRGRDGVGLSGGLVAEVPLPPAVSSNHVAYSNPLAPGAAAGVGGSGGGYLSDGGGSGGSGGGMNVSVGPLFTPPRPSRNKIARARHQSMSVESLPVGGPSGPRSVSSSVAGSSSIYQSTGGGGAGDGGRPGSSGGLGGGAGNFEPSFLDLVGILRRATYLRPIACSHHDSRFETSFVGSEASYDMASNNLPGPIFRSKQVGPARVCPDAPADAHAAGAQLRLLRRRIHG